VANLPEERSTDQQVDDVTKDLSREFAQIPPEAVRRVVAEEFGSFEESRIRTFVPILVRRSAKARLRSQVSA
jgi:hypothetical protein